MKKNDNEMTWQERKSRANKRFYTKYWMVWDYCPTKDGEYGVIEQFPAPMDSGFSHGYIFKDAKVCVSHNCDYPFELNAYWGDWLEDETFENRTISLWHTFTSYEKAKEYSDKVKQNINRDIPTYEQLLVEVKKAFPKAYITIGKRGYETCTKEYKVIVADHGWTTFRIDTKGMIHVQFGQGGEYIIPHLDLVKLCFTDMVWNDGTKKEINYCYCNGEYGWSKFYGIENYEFL